MSQTSSSNSPLDIMKTTRVYRHICDFIKDLDEIFGSRQQSLKLYNYFLENKVDSFEQQSIHVHIFTDFTTKNEEALNVKDYALLAVPTIVYSKKCQVKLGEIFKIADQNEQNTIWKHLLVIKTAINPTEKSIEELKNMEEGSKSFISGLFSQISSSVNTDNPDPMAVITNLFQSGTIMKMANDIQAGLSNGSMTLDGLFQGVQQVAGGNGMGGAEMGNMMSMVSGMMAGMVPPSGGVPSTGDLVSEKKADVKIEEID